MEWREALTVREKRKVYLTLNTSERRLLIRGLLFFRNKVISEGIEAIDIDRLIEKVMK